MSRLTKEITAYGKTYIQCNVELCPEWECTDCHHFKEILTKLKHYEDLEEQGRLIELPCEKVYRIINRDSPKYAFVDRVPIEMMPIYDLKHIDNGNVFFSTKEEAEAKLAELKGDKQ